MANQPTINVAAQVNTTQVKQATKDFSDLKAALANLGQSIPGVNSATNVLSNAFGSAGRGAGAMGGAMAALPALALAAAAAMATLGLSMAFKYTEIIGGFKDIGYVLGTTADQAYYLSRAASDSGGSLDSLRGAGERLMKAMEGSADKTKGAGLAFQRLGVSATDSNGKLRRTDDVMKDLIKSWENGDKSTKSYNAMVDILGKNFQQQINTYKAVEGGQDMYNEMKEKGIGISQKTIELSDEEGDLQIKLGGIYNSMGSILIDQVIPAFIGLTKWFIRSYTEGGFVAKAFTAMVVIVEAVMIVIKSAATVFIVFVEAISLSINAMVAFYDIGKKLVSGDFKGAWEDYKQYWSDLGDNIKGVKDDLAGLWKDTINNSASLKLLRQTSLINDPNNKQEGPTQDGPFGGPGGGTPDPITGQSGGTTKTTESDYDKANKALASLIDGLNKQVFALSNLNQEQNTANTLANESLRIGDPLLKQQALEIARMIDEANARKLLTAATVSLNDVTAKYADAIDLEIQSRNMTARQIAELTALKELDVTIERERIRLREAGLLTSERELELLAAKTKATEGITEATKKAENADNDWFGNGMNEYKRSLGTLNDAMKNFTIDTMGGLSKQFDDLFTTGKFGFREFVASMLTDLAKLLIQFTIMKPIIDSFNESVSGKSDDSSGSGGWMQTAISWGKAYLYSAKGNVFANYAASGDVVNSPTYGMYGGTPTVHGEAGPEAILPLKRNAAGVLGVAMQGGGSGGGATQINNITINSNGQRSEEDDRATARIVSEMLDQKWKENAKQAQRPGGMYNQVSLSV